MFQPDNPSRSGLAAAPVLRTSFGCLAAVALLSAIVVGVGEPSARGSDALDRWTFRFAHPPGPFANAAGQIWDITYRDGLYLAVGHVSGSDLGTIYTSPDALTWTPRHRHSGIDATRGELRRASAAGGRFLAVGWAYTAYISTNGIDWVGGIRPGLSAEFGQGFHDVCHGLGTYVALDDQVGISNILTSVDGLNWTRQRVGVSLGRVGQGRVAFGDGRFVAVGEPGVSGNSVPVAISPDGAQWTTGSLSPAQDFFSLTWGRGLFVAAGRSRIAPYGGAIFTSPDGLSWTPRLEGDSPALSSVACVNGLFIATGDAVLLTSTNGIHWESRSTTNALTRFALGQGRLIGISGGSGAFYWGRALYQTDPLLQLDLLQTSPPEIAVSGLQGQTYRLEFQDELSAPWQPLAELTLPASTHRWPDPTAGGSPSRFYRGTWLP